MAELLSTRDLGQETFSYTHAVREGLAPDGGLYVLAETPQFKVDELRGLQGQPFEAISTAVHAKLVGNDVPLEDLARIAGKAYSADKFTASTNGNIVPIQQIDENRWIQILSTGPTAAFKDIPLQFLGQMIGHVLGPNGGMRIVGATSGDTGSAAEHPFKGMRGIEEFMISPEEGMTEFQKAQMAMLSGGNIHNISIRGGFNEAQQMAKEIKKDPEFADMGAVNSINVGRIFAQVAYVVSGYLQLAGDKVGQPIDISIPTGNFGNTYSVYLAKMMGIPIRNIVIATNENDLVHQLVTTGDYISKERIITSSPSMDISEEASNWERLLSEMVDHDPKKVRDYMGRFKRYGKASLSSVGLGKTAFEQLGISSDTSTHNDRLKTIAEVYSNSHVIIDPHTADAVSVAQRRDDDDVPMLCLSTADPVKFEPTIKEALGFVPEREERFRDIERLIQPDSFTVIDVSVEALKDYIRAHSERPYDMAGVARA